MYFLELQKYYVCCQIPQISYQQISETTSPSVPPTQDYHQAMNYYQEFNSCYYIYASYQQHKQTLFVSLYTTSLELFSYNRSNIITINDIKTKLTDCLWNYFVQNFDHGTLHYLCPCSKCHFLPPCVNYSYYFATI